MKILHLFKARCLTIELLEKTNLKLEIRRTTSTGIEDKLTQRSHVSWVAIFAASSLHYRTFSY